MFTVVGAGFGIYGYLPALVECFGEDVILPREYEGVVAARPELARYRARIRWASDIAAALAQASGAVIAVRPASQPDVVARCCRLPNLERLVLEKPVAADPAGAAGVLRALAQGGKRYRIGYTFLDTAWCRELAWPEEEVRIDWAFMAHHFAHGKETWKRVHSLGGGPLRFYGIHLLALLAQEGYEDVDECVLDGEAPDQPSAWRARFSGPGLPDCRVRVDTRSHATAFSIAGGDRARVELGDPFALAPNTPDDGDRRVPVLASLLRRFDDPDPPYYETYLRTHRLWQATEDAARIGVRG